MADQLQIRGGTTAEHATFTGALKELTVDISKKTVVVHDGGTTGGVPLLREDLNNLTVLLGDSNISPTAAIAVSKLANGSARQLLQTNAAGTGAEWTGNIDVPGTLSRAGSAVVTAGDIGTVTSTMILDGTIVNADVNASAAIDPAKIAGTAVINADLRLRSQAEESAIRLNAAFGVGVAGQIPYGVGPVVPPGMAFFGIGPDAYNPIHLPSGSFC